MCDCMYCVMDYTEPHSRKGLWQPVSWQLHSQCGHDSQGSVHSLACQECLLPTCLSISSLRSAAARCRSRASCSSFRDSVNAALRDSAALSEAASSPVAACAVAACAAACDESSRETQRVCFVKMPGARCQECVVSMVMLQDVALPPSTPCSGSSA